MKSAAVCIVKNEGHGIFEWALYNAFMGFDAIIVYNNNSDDDTLYELAKAAKFADVRVTDWPLHPGQNQAYNHALETHRAEFDTFCMIDADEFIVPIHHSDIRKLLESCADYPHVAIQWAMFGSSGHLERPSGLVSESYTWRAARPNMHVKTICRPSLFREESRFVNPHYMTGSSYVFADGSPVQWGVRPDGRAAWGKLARNGPSDLAQINHYWTKSRADFEAKLARGRATTKDFRSDRFEDVDKNEVLDNKIKERFAGVLDRIKTARSHQSQDMSIEPGW